MAPFALLAAFAAGILLAASIPSQSIASPQLFLVVLLLLAFLLRRSAWAWLPLCALILLIGQLYTAQALRLPPQLGAIKTLDRNLLPTTEAVLISTEQRATGGARLIVQTRRIWSGDKSIPLQLKLLLTLGQGNPQASPGQVIRWRGRLQQPERFGVTGEFDYPLFLAARGIHLTSYLKEADEIVVLVNHPTQEKAWLENQRLELARKIDQTLPNEDAALIKSLLLGLRGGINQEQRNLMTQGGVSHLFAISGLHFGMLSLLLYFIGKQLYSRSERLLLRCPPQRLLPPLLIAPLALYLFLSGNAWATRRAFLMTSVVVLLFCSGRRTAPLSLLATIALVLLLDNPLALFQPGFQLSFTALGGILIWLPSWQRLASPLSPLLRWPLILFLTTVAATLATLPITLWHFHQMSPAGLLTNLIAIPLIAWGAVPTGLAALGIGPIFPFAGELLLHLSSWLTTLALDAVNAILQWEQLQAIMFYPSATHLVLLTGLLLCLLPRKVLPRRHITRLLLLFITIVMAWLVSPPTEGLTVTAISVGQGDAILLSLPNGQHYLVDGGGLPNSIIDPGAKLIAPTLGRRGISHLDGVILTHNHPDHSAGLEHILRHFSITRFWAACSPEQLPDYLLTALSQRGIETAQTAPGWQEIARSEGFRLKIFTPTQTVQDINERSLALYLGNAEQGLLLTGDMGRGGLGQLYTEELPGKTTLAQLPHHGSRSSGPDAYLSFVKPEQAFISVGRHNPYGFPHQETIDACLKRGIRLFRTDLKGSLTFRLQNGQWKISTVKE